MTSRDFYMPCHEIPLHIVRIVSQERVFLSYLVSSPRKDIPSRLSDKMWIKNMETWQPISKKGINMFQTTSGGHIQTDLVTYTHEVTWLRSPNCINSRSFKIIQQVDILNTNNCADIVNKKLFHIFQWLT